MMDPDTKTALVSTLQSYHDAGSDLLEMTPEMYSWTMLYIEPNITHTKVVHAWLCSNMWFDNNGAIEGSRDGTGKGIKEISVTFSPITMMDVHVRNFAYRVLQTLNNGMAISHAPLDGRTLEDLYTIPVDNMDSKLKTGAEKVKDNAAIKAKNDDASTSSVDVSLTE